MAAAVAGNGHEWNRVHPPLVSKAPPAWDRRGTVCRAPARARPRCEASFKLDGLRAKRGRMDNIMQQFIAYAGDFEKTLADDDWSRLRQYFADDAVYEVKADSFGCRLSGPTAIFAGMKKSLDGFDRKFAKREVEVTSGPQVSGGEIAMGWKVVYHKDGLPSFVLRGRSTVRYAGDKIAYLSDDYDASVEGEMAAWQRESGVKIDPSYT